MNATIGDLALRHLLLRLRPLVRALAAAVDRRDEITERLVAAGARGDCITRGHADAVLAALADLPAHASYAAGAPPVMAAEQQREQELSEAATTAGGRLPLLELADRLGLAAFELEVLTLCAAVEIDPGFGLVLAFVHDDASRRGLSVELACTLTAPSILERVMRRRLLAAHGRLRRLKLVAVRGAEGPAQELALTPAALDFLLGGGGDVRARFRDAADVPLAGELRAPPGIDRELVQRTSAGLAAGTLVAVGVFGGREPARRDVARALAAGAGRPLRRLLADDEAGICAAVALGAVVWIDADELDDASAAHRSLVGAAAIAGLPLVVTAAQPWRPPALVDGRAYVELAVGEPTLAERVDLWRGALPELTGDQAADLAVRYRLGEAEVHAAAGMARATAALLRNGHPVSPADHAATAAAAIARPLSLRFGTLIDPRRDADDLVLPPDEQARVREIIAYQRHGERVLGQWGFRHRLTGGGGVKALFCGEPGTGKTLAAEVVARTLGLPLLKIDLARVVSKWVGETEKNLDAAFREAEDGHAVLFFDEAEALFGARADVRTGSDRYANLEVSFLLQRLDSYAGAAILATNLRDKIDQAFMRRFHVVVAFRRPQAPERRRLWRLAFPPAAPLAADVDLEELVRFDLTGAGIVGAAQCAAFLAAEDGASTIAMGHVVRGLARQFQREARVLTRNELGRHAIHLGTS